MSYRLIYTQLAEDNLRDIALRIAQDDVDFAIQYVQNMRAAADNLRHFPDMGSPARFAPARKRGVRILVIDKYILQYLVDHKAKTVYVIKISYGTQSQRKLFEIK